jgi:creatinine amidohydrolase/Fe(II)-dependent formamide hydrolase-like protein
MVDDKFRYEYHTPKTLQETIKRCPLVIQPIGIMEWHGPQNAVGMDGLAGQRICERVIERIGDGLLMPTCWVGTYGYIHYPGSVCYDGETAYRVYKNMFREFVKLGFRLILLISGHGGKWQVRALERARADALKEMKTAITAPTELLGFVYPQMAPGIGVGHAGPVETSILWRIGQEYGVGLVDVKAIPSGKQTIKKYKLPDDNTIDFPANEEPETWIWPPEMRDPSACSPEVGEKVLKAFSDGIFEEIQVYMEELGLKPR